MSFTHILRIFASGILRHAIFHYKRDLRKETYTVCSWGQDSNQEYVRCGSRIFASAIFASRNIPLQKFATQFTPSNNCKTDFFEKFWFHSLPCKVLLTKESHNVRSTAIVHSELGSKLTFKMLYLVHRLPQSTPQQLPEKKSSRGQKIIKKSSKVQKMSARIFCFAVDAAAAAKKKKIYTFFHKKKMIGRNFQKRPVPFMCEKAY